MALTIQDELEERVAAVLHAMNTNGVMRGVLTQIVPVNDVDVYEKLVGDAKRPFWSVSSVSQETFNEGESFNDRDSWIRPVTVVLYAEKLSVENHHDVYRWIRTNAIRSLNKFRFTGDFATDPRSCLLYGVASPKSQVEAAAWMRSTGFVSAFDIRFKTLETRNVI